MEFSFIQMNFNDCHIVDKLFRARSCVVCKKSLKLERIETWRNVIHTFFKDVEKLKKIFEVVKEHALKSSDDDIRASAVSKCNVHSWFHGIDVVFHDSHLTPYAIFIESMA